MGYPSRNWTIVFLLLILLLAAALRSNGLHEMQHFLHFDEASVGLDALSLLEEPRLTPYFPRNSGRESLWMYAQAVGLALFGTSAFSLRVVALFTGVLCVAALVPLGREVLGRRGGVWTAGALAMLYWHVHMSHLAFRVGLFPLIGALALAALLKAYRRNRGWALAGGLLGLLSYTYIAARSWVIFGGLLLLWWALRRRERRRGALAALGIAVVLGLPLGAALLVSTENTEHVQRVVIEDSAALLDNLVQWANALLVAGDPIDTHNYDSRPVFDLPLALLAGLGLLGAWYVVRRKTLLIGWALLLLASLIPTVLATQAPHYLRGAGLLVPLALLVGAGGAWLSRWRWGTGIACGLLLWAGLGSYGAFSAWVQDVEFGLVYYEAISDYELNRALRIVKEETPAEMPLVIPALDEYAVLEFQAATLPQRETYFYTWQERNGCFLTPRQEALFLDLPGVLNNFQGRAQPYTDNLRVLDRQENGHHNLFQLVPNADLIVDWEQSALIADLLEVQAVSPVPQQAAPGDTLVLHLGLRVRQTPPQPYRFFVHLQNEPTPYEGGTLWSTGDAPLCDVAYQDVARAEVTLVQPVALPLPADLAPGDYHVAVGLYDPADNTRPPLQTPSGETRYARLLEVRVEP